LVLTPLYRPRFQTPAYNNFRISISKYVFETRKISRARLIFRVPGFFFSVLRKRFLKKKIFKKLLKFSSVCPQGHGVKPLRPLFAPLGVWAWPGVGVARVVPSGVHALASTEGHPRASPQASTHWRPMVATLRRLGPGNSQSF
jgi:hypothetical protein